MKHELSRETSETMKSPVAKVAVLIGCATTLALVLQFLQHIAEQISPAAGSGTTVMTEGLSALLLGNSGGQGKGGHVKMVVREMAKLVERLGVTSLKG